MAALTMDETDSTPGLSPRPDAGALITPVSVPAGDKWSVVRNNVAQEMTDRKELNDVFAERERIRKAAEKVTNQTKPQHLVSSHSPGQIDIFVVCHSYGGCFISLSLTHPSAH